MIMAGIRDWKSWSPRWIKRAQSHKPWFTASHDLHWLETEIGIWVESQTQDSAMKFSYSIPFHSIPFHSIFDIVYMPMWMGKIQMWRKVGRKNVSIFSSVSAGMGGDGPTSSCQTTSASGDGERVIWWQLISLNVEKSGCFLRGFDSSEIFSLLGKFCHMFLGFVDTLRCTYLSHRPWKDCLNHDSMKSMHFNYKAKCLPQNQPL